MAEDEDDSDNDKNSDNTKQKDMMRNMLPANPWMMMKASDVSNMKYI